jgi:hypothetical protein
MLAVEFDVDRGATSFHLRQLGAHGFIEVDEERSSGRRKYWRLVGQDLVFPSADSSVGGLGETVSRLLWQTSLQALVEFHARSDPWREAAETSHSAMRLTEAELRDFRARYHELLAEYGRPAEAAPDGARPVTALFAAFPNEPPPT